MWDPVQFFQWIFHFRDTPNNEQYQLNGISKKTKKKNNKNQQTVKLPFGIGECFDYLWATIDCNFACNLNNFLPSTIVPKFLKEKIPQHTTEMFITGVLLRKGPKSKNVMVLMESVVSGHKFIKVRERLADKLELVRFDPFIQMDSVYRERKKIRSM